MEEWFDLDAMTTVHADGEVTLTYAPDWMSDYENVGYLIDNPETTEIDGGRKWRVWTGMKSNQGGYLMHESETLPGWAIDKMLATPGHYAVVPLWDDYGNPQDEETGEVDFDCVGWAIFYAPPSN